MANKKEAEEVKGADAVVIPGDLLHRIRKLCAEVDSAHPHPLDAIGSQARAITEALG